MSTIVYASAWLRAERAVATDAQTLVIVQDTCHDEASAASSRRAVLMLAVLTLQVVTAKGLKPWWPFHRMNAQREDNWTEIELTDVFAIDDYL